MADRRRNALAIKARREHALARPELRKPADPVTVTPSAGVTSPPVRAFEPELRAMIDAALARSTAKRDGDG